MRLLSSSLQFPSARQFFRPPTSGRYSWRGARAAWDRLQGARMLEVHTRISPCQGQERFVHILRSSVFNHCSCFLMCKYSEFLSSTQLLVSSLFCDSSSHVFFLFMYFRCFSIPHEQIHLTWLFTVLDFKSRTTIFRGRTFYFHTSTLPNCAATCS